MPLWKWVRPNNSAKPGPDPDRLQILRDLKSDVPGKKKDVERCHFLLVQALIAYSQGKKIEDDGEDGEEEGGTRKKKNKKKPVLPYGNQASWDSEAFKEVPVASFAATIVTLYPLVVMETPGMWFHIVNTYPDDITY